MTVESLGDIQVNIGFDFEELLKSGYVEKYYVVLKNYKSVDSILSTYTRSLFLYCTKHCQ